MIEKVFVTKSKIELMGIKNLLNSEGIECFEVDTMDSAYAGIFGQYELKVAQNDVEKANEIIDKFQKNNKN